VTGPFRLVHQTARNLAIEAVRTAPDGYICTIKPPTRSLEANARMWVLLGELSEQLEWYGRKLSPESWKHVLSSSLKKLEVVPNIEGTGFVALGLSTSKMTRQEMSDMMTLIEAFGAERGVRFSSDLPVSTKE